MFGIHCHHIQDSPFQPNHTGWYRNGLGKKYETSARLFLGTFAAVLRRTTNQPGLTGGQVKSSIKQSSVCVASLTSIS